MTSGFKREGRFYISRLTEYQYQVGEIGIELFDLELDEEERASLDEYIKDTFGEDAFIIGMPSTATMVFQIGSKKLRKEFGEKLLAKGREAEAKSYLEEIK